MITHRPKWWSLLAALIALCFVLAGCGGQHKYTVTLPSGHTVTQAHSPEIAAPKPGTPLPAQITPIRHSTRGVAPVAEYVRAHIAGVHPLAAGDVVIPTVEQFDSVTVSTVPKSAHYVAGYVDGSWPTYFTMRGHWPVVVGISVSTQHGADCFDMEPGNPGPENAGPWAVQQIKDGNLRPCLYSMLSWMPDIRSSLAAHGIPHCSATIVVRCYVLWDANWTYHQHLDSGYDCTQWTDHAYNLNLDESTCLLSFYLRGAPPKPGPNGSQVKSWAGARAASIAAYHRRCTRPVFTTGTCGQLAWRVNHYQGLLDKTGKQVWRCFGPRANAKAAICQIVRPAVAVWSNARSATSQAEGRNGCVSAHGRVRSKLCLTLNQRFVYFDRRARRTVITSRY